MKRCSKNAKQMQLIQLCMGRDWKHPEERSSVTLLVLIQALRVNILKSTVEKNETNVTNALLNLYRQAIWGRVWKHTVEINQTNATNTNFCPFRFVFSDFRKTKYYSYSYLEDRIFSYFSYSYSLIFVRPNNIWIRIR